MENASVPVVPGYHGENQDPDFLLQQAEKIGMFVFKYVYNTQQLMP
jgi:acetyl/propionyl-CoA carboxylase alpha subunit